MSHSGSSKWSEGLGPKSGERTDLKGSERTWLKSGERRRKKDFVKEIFAPRYGIEDKDFSSEQESNQRSTKTFMSHRCCSASPQRTDFCQIVDLNGRETAKAYDDQYRQILFDQYGFNPIEKLPKRRVTQLRDVMRMLTSDPSKDYEKTEKSHIQTPDGAQWQTVDSPEDVDKYLSPDLSCLKDDHVSLSSPVGIPLSPIQTQHRTHKKSPIQYRDRGLSPCFKPYQRKKYPKDKPLESLTRDKIRISETPRVKIIAEKYSKIKKKNIEIRKLEEKVVCVEYDVFDKNDMKTPRQKLRSFFSIKPVAESQDQGDDKRYPDAEVNYEIDKYDFERLTNKEVEILDGKLKENESYLNDLRRILKRKKASLKPPSKSDINSLALMGLYDLAIHDKTCQNLISKSQVLTDDKLEEMKNMIVMRTSSATWTGINRRKVKTNSKEKYNFKLLKGSSIISQSFFNELLRESSKV